jgi:tetratricopeptide (TPR) repeat protein
MSRDIPSVEDFLRFFERKQYYKAIGLSETASAAEINSRIDLFELEYLERSSEWAIPLATIKQAILQNKDEMNEQQIIKTRNISPKKIVIQDPIAMRKSMEILAQAEKFEQMGKLKVAIDICTKSIVANPNNVWAYKKRAWDCLLLPDYHSYLQQIIEDCTKIIELEPHDTDAYNNRGRAYARKGEFGLAIKDYHAAIKLMPSYTIAALNCMEVDICLGDYKDAIATYGAWRPDVVSDKERLISEWLIGIALTLDGKDSKYQSVLNNKKIKIRNMADWCTDEIEKYLSKLEREKYDSERLKKAKEIHGVFTSHFQ